LFVDDEPAVVDELVDLDVAGDAQLTSWPGFLTLTPYAAE
jgi:hypothetical protein